MTSWSYSYAPLASSGDRDKVRFLVGDVDPKGQMLSDAEIDFTLDKQGGNIMLAAAMAADAIAARFACCVDESVGALSRSNSQKFKHFKELADCLRKEASQGLAEMFVGGASKSHNDLLRGDDGATQPYFFRGMLQFPENRGDGSDPNDGC